MTDDEIKKMIADGDGAAIPTHVIQKLTDAGVPQDDIDALYNDPNPANAAWRMLYAVAPPKTSRKKPKKTQIEVCFSGTFAVRGREAWEELMQNTHHWFIRTGVTKNLDYLVVGDNAGPSKLKKAHAQECTVIISEEELVSIVDKLSL